ncbi:TPA: hypothetical protein HA241_06835 [Candidatus Woesearchaeota archaeon]|nr:hypothetical protein [Candidatus Woesearchaeota archaeon]
MDPRLFVYSGIGLIVGIVLFIKGFLWLKQKRLIENIPTSKIRSLAMGLVEIHGDVVPFKELLTGPFSKKECVYYYYTIEEYRRSGKNSKWITIKHGEQSTPFFLKDNTGSVLINPTGAKIDAPLTTQYESGLMRDPPAAIRNFLTQQNLNFESFFGINKKMRFTEYSIPPATELYILGTAGDNPHMEETTALKGVEDVMIQHGNNDKTYFISTKNEHQLLSSLRWKTIGGIGGGFILSIGSLIVMLIYFGLF